MCTHLCPPPFFSSTLLYCASKERESPLSLQVVATTQEIMRLGRSETGARRKKGGRPPSKEGKEVLASREGREEKEKDTFCTEN